MEYLDQLFNTIGVVPAEWFTQMNLEQKQAFLTMAATAAIFAAGFFILLLTSRREKGMSNEELTSDEKLRRDIGQDIHDLVLFERLYKKEITPKQYKSLCRQLNPLFPGFLPYSWRAKRQMKETNLKIAIADRLINGVHKPSGITTFLRSVREYTNSARDKAAVFSKKQS
jgi:hypothetical protein